jgi:hypothetical protein
MIRSDELLATLYTIALAANFDEGCMRTLHLVACAYDLEVEFQVKFDRHRQRMAAQRPG